MPGPIDPQKRRVISQMDVIARCKQCGGPITDFNKIMGPTGMFCSEECKQRHEAFTRRAAAIESNRPAHGGLRRFLGSIVGRAVFMFIVLVVIGLAASIFHIPVIGDIVERIPGFMWLRGLIPLG